MSLLNCGTQTHAEETQFFFPFSIDILQLRGEGEAVQTSFSLLNYVALYKCIYVGQELVETKNSQRIKVQTLI